MKEQIMEIVTPIYEQVKIGEKKETKKVWVASDESVHDNQFLCERHETTLAAQKEREEAKATIAGLKCFSNELNDYFSWYLFNSEEDFCKFAFYLTGRKYFPREYLHSMDKIVFPEWIGVIRTEQNLGPDRYSFITVDILEKYFNTFKKHYLSTPLEEEIELPDGKEQE